MNVCRFGNLITMNRLLLICLFCFGVTISKAQKVDSVGKKTKEDAKIFSWVENMPGFPGGFNAYQRFLASNLTYPEKARLRGIKGIVMVYFVVEKDGSLSHVEVRKSHFRELDEEAIRVISISPKWTAGMQNGRPVRVQFSLPITFPPEPLAVPKDTAVFYIKMVGDRETQVDSKDKADFYRMVLPPDTTVDKTRGIINDFYKNGHKKMIGGAIIIEQQLLLSGSCIEFYENGKRKSIKNYVDGVQTGVFSQYYPSGRLYIAGEYDPKGGRIIKEARDTTGKVTASDGTGNMIIYTNDFKRIVEEGPIVNGLEDGEWHGMSADSARSVLNYKQGLFQNGKTFDKKGLEYPDDPVLREPSFPGGINAFFKFLQHTIRYPVVAKEAGVQGQVFVSFNVERDGSLTNVYVAKGAGSGLDEEAMRVIKLSSKWNPGIQGGIPVRRQYTIPISFSLQTESK